MFYDVIPCQTTSELHLFMDLTYHVLLGHAKVCLSCTKVCMSCAMVCLSCAKGLSVMHHDCNHDSHVIAMTSQCGYDDITHVIRMQ